MGYDAAMTDLKMADDTIQLRRIGIAMSCIFAVMIVGHCLALWKEMLFPFSHGCSHCSYIIMAPIVGVRMREEMEMNRLNVELLDNF